MASLSVCLVTANSADRLGWWCAQVRHHADEVVVAVDASSTDDTYAIARRHADQVHAVEVGGVPGLARDWLHHQAGGDWILMLDDDELLPPGAGALLADLVRDRTVTHYRLPVRRIVDDGATMGWVRDPAAGPDGSVRLWRHLGGLHFSDPSGAAVPAVRGLGRTLPESGSLAVYSMGHLWSGEPAGATLAGTIAFDVPMRPDRATARTESPGPEQIITSDELRTHVETWNPATPPWSADYRLLDAPLEVMADRGALLRVAIRNTSRALWATTGHQGDGIVLGNRWSTPEFGDEISMGDTTRLPRPIAPGEEVELEAGVWAPRVPGRYRLTVGLIRAGHAWFSQHGVTPLTLDVTVTAGDTHPAVRHYSGRLQDDPDRDPSTPVPSSVVPFPPVRVLDTRDGSGLVDAVRGPLDQDGVVVLRLAGAAGVPPEASGVVATMTVLDADYHGWLAVFGTDGTKGEAFPALHFFDDGRPVTATTITALGVGRGHGKLSCHLAPGPARSTGQLIVDLCGYLVAAPGAHP